jgi:hypothetical protein
MRPMHNVAKNPLTKRTSDRIGSVRSAQRITRSAASGHQVPKPERRGGCRD